MRRAAEQTPARRDRYVDLLRALAISLVVLGHWLAVVVVRNNGLDGENALGHVPWAQPLTWVFQVMPVFFLVGGYANAASLRSHLGKGGDGTGWLLGRTDRLLRPTTAFLVVLFATAVTARLLGADPGLVGTGAWAASIPLWFFAAYLAVVLATPAMHALHRRYGAAVPVVMVGGVLLLDVLRMGAGVPLVGEANYLLVWLAMHQFGFLWRDHRMGPVPSAVAAAAGFALLLALTTVGPYPTSMVGVPGEDLTNTAPPTFALLVLGMSQTALALALAAPARRALARTGFWTVVVVVNAVVLTLFLWHMTAAVLMGALVYGTGLLPQPPVGSGEWLLLRVPWLLAAAMMMLVLVAVFGGVEARTRPSSAGWRAGDLRGVPPARAARNVLVWVALAAVLVGFVWSALAMPEQRTAAGVPVAGLAVYVAGASVLRLARRSTDAHTDRVG